MAACFSPTAGQDDLQFGQRLNKDATYVHYTANGKYNYWHKIVGRQWLL